MINYIIMDMSAITDINRIITAITGITGITTIITAIITDTFTEDNSDSKLRINDFIYSNINQIKKDYNKLK